MEYLGPLVAGIPRFFPSEWNGPQLVSSSLPATLSRANAWSSHPLPRVHEDETSRAIGALRLPFAEARLPEKRRLARVRDEEKRHPTVNTHTQQKRGEETKRTSDQTPIQCPGSRSIN